MLNLNQKTIQYLKWALWIMLIAALSFLYFQPHAVEYSDYRVVRALSFPIMPFLTVLLIFAAVVINNKIVKPSSVIITGVVSLLVTFIIILPVFNFGHTIDNRNELLSKGTSGKAIVINKKNNRNDPNHWQIKCGFKVNNHRYETSYYNDNKGVYSVGDTIDIIYNKDYPRMYELDTKRLYN